MTPKQILKELRKVADKRRGEATDTFAVRISDMCDDAANAIEELQAIIDGCEKIGDTFDTAGKEPCIHCNGGRALIIDDDNDRGIAIQHPNKLIAFGYDPNGPSSNGVSCIINYCPMCGIKVGGVL